MDECLKSMQRRLHEPAFHQRYFVGDALDVGCGEDSLAKHAYLFPRLTSVRSWDLPDGDGQTLPGVENSAFDLVHSSHSLEHMHDPHASLTRWMQVLKPGGHIVAIVPEVDLYEHGFWPSRYNGDHKTSYSIDRDRAEDHALAHDNARAVCVADLLNAVRGAKIIKIELLEATYNFGAVDPIADQTANGTAAECGIEFVIRKVG